MKPVPKYAFPAMRCTLLQLIFVWHAATHVLIGTYARPVQVIIILKK